MEITKFVEQRQCRTSVARRIIKLGGPRISEGQEIRGFFRKPISYRKAKRRIERGRRVYGHRLKGGKIHNPIYGPSPLYAETR